MSQPEKPDPLADHVVTLFRLMVHAVRQLEDKPRAVAARLRAYAALDGVSGADIRAIDAFEAVVADQADSLSVMRDTIRHCAARVDQEGASEANVKALRALRETVKARFEAGARQINRAGAELQQSGVMERVSARVPVGAGDTTTRFEGAALKGSGLGQLMARLLPTRAQRAAARHDPRITPVRLH